MRIVAAQDALVAAEDDVRGRNEGEVLLQPVELGIEAGGHFHRGCRDVDLVVLLQPLENALGMRHHAQDGEEILGHHVVGESLLAFGRNDVPEPLAVQVGARDALGEIAVVAQQVLAERVGDDLVHVHADDAAACAHATRCAAASS